MSTKADVSAIPDDTLLRRAVGNARSNKYGRRKHPRWVGVQEAFSLGATFAHQLCERFGFDPDEEVRR